VGGSGSTQINLALGGQGTVQSPVGAVWSAVSMILSQERSSMRRVKRLGRRMRDFSAERLAVDMGGIEQPVEGTRGSQREGTVEPGIHQLSRSEPGRQGESAVSRKEPVSRKRTGLQEALARKGACVLAGVSILAPPPHRSNRAQPTILGDNTGIPDGGGRFREWRSANALARSPLGRSARRSS